MHKTKQRILKELAKRKSLKTSVLVSQFGISRQTLANHLKKLILKGLVKKTGSTRNAVYSLAKNGTSPVTTCKLIKKAKGLEEHLVFEDIDSKLNLKKRLNKLCYQIAAYSFSEMLNNAIEHSCSKKIYISVIVDSYYFSFEIRDFGVGVYDNVKRKFELQNEFEALEHVFKGKQTTNPVKHSGEGIFFTSRIANKFILRSHKLQTTIDNEINDVFVKELRFIRGTLVSFSISKNTKKNLQNIFREYTGDDFDFNRSIFRVKLSNAGGLLARSQARRLLSGLDKYKVIIFDFKGVSEIGQGFADEIFRVFTKEHPDIIVEYSNGNPAVEFMILRARAASKTRG